MVGQDMRELVKELVDMIDDFVRAKGACGELVDKVVSRILA